MRFVLALLLLAVSSASVTAQSSKPHVVMLVAEREYQTEKTLTEFARQHLDGQFQTTFVFADREDANRMDGIEAVEKADVLVVSVRRRTLPKKQLDVIRRYVAAGKPVIGIRTASHAFCLRNQPAPQGRAAWPEWDKEVFGGNYTNHYGNQLKATISFGPPNSAGEALLRGINAEPFAAGGSLYQVSPIDQDATAFMFGRVDGHDSEPVAWTFNREDGGKSFYTSLGHIDDFGGQTLPQLLVNAILWATQKDNAR